MRSLAALTAIAGALALIIACGGGGGAGDGQSDSNSPSASAPALTATPDFNHTAPPTRVRPSNSELEARIQACLNSAPDPPAAVVESCVGALGFFARARPADGDVPVVLIDVRDPPLPPLDDCSYGSSFIAYQAGGPWQVESIDRLLPGHDPGTRLISSVPPILHLQAYSKRGPGARSVAVDGTSKLGVIYGTLECGSRPEEAYLLLELAPASAKLLWRSTPDHRTYFGHTIIDFEGEGIDQIRIVGDSWFREDDKRNLFDESNAGPHRYFEQTWVRAGDTYELHEEHALPSAYNTLVEFVYRLSTGDMAGASTLVTDPALVDTAISLGLVQAPLGQRWLINPYPDAVCCGPIYITYGPSVKVSFDASGTDWLISEIVKEAYRSQTPVR